MSILLFLDRLMGGVQEPIDVEADAIIRAFFKRNPDAAYRVTKLVMELSLQDNISVSATRPKTRKWFTALLERRDLFAQ